MLKRLQIWWFLKTLERKYKKEGKWDINIDFLSAINNRIKKEWLNNYTIQMLTTCEINMHYLSYVKYINALETINGQIKKYETITIPHKEYLIRPSQYIAADYFVNEKYTPIDLVSVLENITANINGITNQLIICKEQNEIQYNYYLRTLDKIISDTLEIYWCFIEIGKK